MDRLTPLFFSSFNSSEFSHSANTTTTPPSLFRFLYNLPLQTHAPTLEKASLNSFFSSSTQVHSLTIQLKSSAEKFWVSFSFFLSFTLLFYGFARCLLAILLVLTQFLHHRQTCATSHGGSKLLCCAVSLVRSALGRRVIALPPPHSHFVRCKVLLCMCVQCNNVTAIAERGRFLSLVLYLSSGLFLS